MGNDVLFGEAWIDTFVFERGTGGDVIGDFAAGTDKVQLAGLGFSSFALGRPEQVLRQASLDRLGTNGKQLISFVVSPSISLRTGLSNHTANQLVQGFPRCGRRCRRMR